ncbi:KH domain-containing protein HEN4-like isoform X6 [Phragmites australis]|uniref:KH domain-containing protein HEN4-like isoform X6 n=1 Tax=Phragmites australis TaxID=29695 RepID=UPI002D765092|nr:KH domain-containing protein HEN4-like isoform X6 [Phragmites australis]
MEIFTPAGAASSSSSSTPSTKRSTTMLRLLCPSSRASALRPARDLHVDQPPVGDEAVLTISGRDAPDAAVRAWERVVGHRVGGDEAGGGEEGEREVAGAVGCRMLAAGGQVGCVLGKGGKTVERMRQESGAQIRVFRNREQLPPCAAPGDELIHNSDMMHSPAQDAVLRVHSRISEASVDKSSSAPARLLVPSQHIGCLLGKGGSIIAEMRKVTGASIRIFANEQIPRCAQRNDEMVQDSDRIFSESFSGCRMEEFGAFITKSNPSDSTSFPPILIFTVTGSFQSIQDALIHITGRIRDIIIPKPHPSGGMPPYPPVGNIPLHQSRQEPAPPHPSGGMPPYPMHSFRADTPMGPFDTGDHRRPPPHSMEHMGADRMSYSYGCEQGGPQPFLEQPPPRTWAPEAPKTNSEALRNMPDAVPATDFRKGAVASENQVATPTSTTEVVIPCKYVSFVCGTNGSDLEEIKKMSGASITVHDPKPGDTNSTIVICGDPEQTKKAQSLIHAFIFCGLYQT